MDKIITIPFGYLLDFLYQFTTNYGVALILFAILVKLILLPVTAKSKKSMMKMSRLTPRIQAIQKKYPNDQQKQNEAMQALYKEEGVTTGCGGCLWSLVPMLILIPLYQVVRQPIVFMLHETAENAETIVSIVKEGLPNLFNDSNTYYQQMIAAANMKEFAPQILEKIPDISKAILDGLNFNFLNINLGEVPTYNIFDSSVWAWDWAHIGAFLIPVLSAGSQVLSMLISQRMNNSVVTDEKGIEDKETAKNSQANQSTKMMLWMMPIMSLIIGFGVPAALSLYWLVQGLVSIIIDVILTNKYRKIYDAEDAARLQRAMEAEAEEAERERQRAQRRAENPDGITANTSKKKLQRQQQQAEEAAKAAAAREYAEKKGITFEEEEEKHTMSGIPDRPFAKGRAYDPNRYSSETTEE